MLQRLKRDRDEFLKELTRLSQVYEKITVSSCYFQKKYFSFADYYFRF